MIRNFRLIGLMFLMSPLTVFGLGLGELTTQSALNQVYQGEIELLSVGPGEEENIRVNLASPKAFSKAGVERPFFLSTLTFTPATKDDGKSVIKISSRAPVREPFLNFLIEVNWAKGRLVREYTVLLDPPVVSDDRPAVINEPKVVTQPTRALQAYAPEETVKSETEYGPIKANETLWSIARSVKQEQTSIEQMMMGLLQANPHAFVDNNVNRLRKGKVLRIPDVAELNQMTRQQARQAYRQQQDDWLASKTVAPEKAGGSESAEGVAAKEDELRIVTKKPKEEEGTEGSSITADTTIDGLDEQLLLAREEAESSRQRADQLQDSVANLEEQLADLKRLLELKDDQLAQLQSSFAQEEVTEQEQSTTDATTDEAMAAAETALAPQEKGVEDAPKDEKDQVEVKPEVTQQQATTEMADTQKPETEMDAQPDPKLKTEVKEKPVEIKKTEKRPIAAPPPSQPAPAKTKPWWKDLFAEQIWTYLVALSGLLVILAGVIILRRRNEEERKALLEEGETILHDPNAIRDAGPQTQMLDSDTSFLSEFSSEELHALQEETSDVDPVSEADVYIAYGRYQQAQDLLRQAIGKDPERLSLKHKLLEVFYATKDAASFISLAESMARDGDDGKDPDTWESVVRMGRELDKDYALFADDKSVVLEDASSESDRELDLGLDAMTENVAREYDAETSLQEAVPEEVLTEQETIDELSETLGESLESSLSLDTETEPMEGLESLDLEMPDLDEHSREYEPTDVNLGELDLEDLGGGVEQSTQINEDSDLVDLDLSDTDEESTSAMTEIQEPGDMPGLGFETVSTEIDAATDDSVEELAAQIQNDTVETAFVDDDLDGDLELLDDDLGDLDDELLDEPLSIDDAFDHMMEDEEDDDLASVLDVPDVEGDDNNTKLDLARAYIEMGDAEGAKVMLEEIKSQGSTEQQAEAERILSTI